MRVLVVSNWFYPHIGGIEINAYRVSREMVKHGFDVTAIASGPAGKEIIDGIKVIRAPILLRAGRANISPTIFSEVMRQDFDLMHIHCPNPLTNKQAWLACKLKRKPYIITYHSDIIKFGFIASCIKDIYVKLFQRLFLLRGAKKIMPTSPDYVEVSDSLPRFRDKIKVVHSGLDLDEFKPSKKKVLSKEFPKNKIILFMGRLIYYKGVEYLLRAMQDVVKKVPSAKLVVVGSGDKEHELKQLAKELGIDKHIVWKGTIKDEERIPYYSESDVFVLPSIYKTEAFGLVQLEAMACGCPTIGTTVSGTRYILKDAGIAVPPKDERALADAIIRVLTDKKLATKMRKDGFKKVKAFDWKVIGNEMKKIYDDVL